MRIGQSALILFLVFVDVSNAVLVASNRLSTQIHNLVGLVALEILKSQDKVVQLGVLLFC